MSPSPDHPAPAPHDPLSVPHRKNAAEWMMWLALLPLLPVAHLLERIRTSRGPRHG